MDKKEDIGTIFKEGLADIKKTPGNDVWDKIEARLDEKEDRKLLPLWFKWAGMAAGFAILLVGGTYFFSRTPIENIPVISDIDVTNDTIDTEQLKSKKPFINSDKNNTNNALDIKNTDARYALEKDGAKGDQLDVEERVANDKDESSKIVQQLHKTSGEITAISNKKKQLIDNVSGNKTEITTLNTNENDKIALKEITNNGQNLDDKIHSEINFDTTKDSIAVVENEIKNDKLNGNIVPEKIPDSIADSVRVVENDQLLDDTIIDTEEDVKPELVQDKKWSISPRVAPLYSSSFGANSSLNSNVLSTKTGTLNFSYGIDIAYQVSSKFALGVGVNNLDVSYIFDVDTTEGNPLATQGLVENENIAISDGVVLIMDGVTLSPGEDTEGIEPEQLKQEINYIEVPLQGRYKISARKLSMDVVGGVSVYFLEKNSLLLKSNTTNFSKIGVANNLNSLSYSGNIGFGFGYKLKETVYLNVDPLLKFQFNSVENASDFNPYTFGMYFGLNYKF